MMYDILTISIGIIFTVFLYLMYWRTKSPQLINYIPSVPFPVSVEESPTASSLDLS